MSLASYISNNLTNIQRFIYTCHYAKYDTILLHVDKQPLKCESFIRIDFVKYLLKISSGPDDVKIFTLKTPTLIIKEYISTRFKEERDPYKGTGSEIYIIKKVTRKRTQRPIIGSSMPNTNQSDSRFRYC